MALTPLHVTDVCYGCGHQWAWPPPTTKAAEPCKYLKSEYDSKLGYVDLCTKLTPSEYAKLKNKAGKGDNCNGYTYLKYKKQGYDVP